MKLLDGNIADINPKKIDYFLEVQSLKELTPGFLTKHSLFNMDISKSERLKSPVFLLNMHFKRLFNNDVI